MTKSTQVENKIQNKSSNAENETSQEEKTQINISLINYKILSGSYIIFEKNGTGKEYSFYENKLRFEGGYLNGKRNGKGKEYDYFCDNEYLVFEGDYVNGEKHGKGKEFFINGVIKFEGEYFRRKKWNGKGYNMNKELVYELNNGKGYVKEYNDFNNCIIYEGEYLNGEKNGKGKEYDDDGNLIFEGEYLNGERNGKVKKYDYDGNLRFEGEYLNRKRNGKGKEYLNNKLIFR